MDEPRFLRVNVAADSLRGGAAARAAKEKCAAALAAEGIPGVQPDYRCDICDDMGHCIFIRYIAPSIYILGHCILIYIWMVCDSPTAPCHNCSMP